jgi:hypothetical protein
LKRKSENEKSTWSADHSNEGTFKSNMTTLTRDDKGIGGTHRRITSEHWKKITQKDFNWTDEKLKYMKIIEY